MKRLKNIVLTLWLLIMVGIISTSFSPIPYSNQANIVVVNDQDFDKTIEKGIVIVDFYATWCGPCKQLSPILETLATEMTGKIKVAKLDVDKNKQTAARFAIRSLPTLMVFKNGKAVERIIGLREKEYLALLIKKHI